MVRHALALLLGGVVSLTSATPGAAQERLAFIGVALDSETRQADNKLQDYLERRAGVKLHAEEHEYDRAIDRLANWDDPEGFFLARTTPYVYVAAEMLGADLEVLATYVSATTQQRTYNSYFVVNRTDFPEQPNLDEVMHFLTTKDSPARFIFHSQFSTSSYFLPTLVFRSRKIFNMEKSTESLTAVNSAKISGNSSTRLVQAVAAGEADLAAVWDGTKAKFEPGHSSGLFESEGSKVYFVQLPTTLPNDLLVCSAALDPEVKERLRAAVREMPPDGIGIGDFQTWQDVTEATDARLALAGLRWLARERVAPVTIDSRLAATAEQHSESAMLVEAVRQAVRYSGTEFVLFDEDFHEHVDFVWILEVIHDGAILLRSTVPGSGVEEQRFQISFQDSEDLTRRMVSIIQSRVHRIRYVWPYSSSPPIVLRDLALSIPDQTTVKVQKISWLDPEKNAFRGGSLFDARTMGSGFHTYRLNPDDFPDAADDAAGFDAMSNVSYRVLLLQHSEERALFIILTWVLLGLLVLAAGFAVLSLRSSRLPAAGDEPSGVSSAGSSGFTGTGSG